MSDPQNTTSPAQKVSEAAFNALSQQRGLTGYYYAYSTEPDIETPWMAADYSLGRTGSFATEAEVLAFFSIPDANKAPVLDAKADEPLPQAPTAPEASSEPQASAPGQSADSIDAPENPFSTLSDEELAAKIRQGEEAYYAECRRFASAESRLASLSQQFADANADLITEKKESAPLKALKAEELKAVATEYARRHPNDKQFDVYVSFKAFEDIEIDEVAAWPWVRTNFSVAIIPQVDERLDMKQLAELAKSRKKLKQSPLPFVKFKPRTEVQLSSKIPEAPVAPAEEAQTPSADQAPAPSTTSAGTAAPAQGVAPTVGEDATPTSEIDFTKEGAGGASF